VVELACVPTIDHADCLIPRFNYLPETRLSVQRTVAAHFPSEQTDQLENGMLTKPYAALAAALIAVPLLASTATAADLTLDAARALADQLYQVVNQPGSKDVKAVLSAAVTPDFRSYASNDSFKTLDEAAAGIVGLGSVVPDLSWKIMDVMVSGDRMIVRGEATGTPAMDFFGVPHTGKSFRIMSIDIWTVTDGKASSVYHLEDWAGAIGQLSAQ
jgi:predicted ester cyclase